MVSHPIDPGPQRATRIEPLEAPPKLEMDFLDEVAPLFRVGFVGPRQPFQRGAVLVRGFPVAIMPARVFVQDGPVSPISKVVGAIRSF